MSRRLPGLQWRPMVLEDRAAIMSYVAEDNPVAALTLDLLFEDKTETLRQRHALYKPGRVPGTREMVVRPNYIVVYRVLEDAVEIVRVLHAAQRWP